MIKTLSNTHKDLLLDLIQVRVDTIVDDPTSADNFESIESLGILEHKIYKNNLNFTSPEKIWLMEEIENRLDKIPTELKVLLEIVREQNQEKDRIKKLPPMERPIQIVWSESGNKNGLPYTFSQKYKYNDGGRAEAGYKGYTGDCVARSIAIASGIPYQEVYDTLANGNATQRKGKRKRRFTGVKTASHGINVKRKWFKDYMKSLGFEWYPTMFVGQGCKTHLRSDELPNGRLVVALSKHYTTMIDGVIHDTYDPSRRGTRAVYGYYLKK